MIAFSLPWPPSVNRYWRHGKGRTYISKEGREYKATVEAALKSTFLHPSHKRMVIEIVACRGDRRRYDLDNLFKCVLDSLEGVVYLDDSQIDRLLIERGPVVPPGVLRCKVGEI